MVSTRCVGVRGNWFRHVRQSSLEQSIKSMTILQVVGRKVVVLENPFRLDVVGFQDVTQEDRDVARVVARDVLAALDGRATRGAGLGANKAAIIDTGWAMSIRFACRTATFASTMVLDEGKIQFFTRAPRELEPPRAAGAGESSSGSDMSWRPAPGRSTPAPLRVTGKARRPGPVRLGGLPDQTCSKCSSGFSDTLGVPVCPVDGCGCCVLRGELYMGVDCMYGCSVSSVALCSVNHCSREEPVSHSPTVPWVCDARYTVACLGRPYL